MSMKKTDLEKNKAKKLADNMKQAPIPGRFGKESAAPLDKREQRKRDQELGLVPFAVKLHGDLVKQLRDRAEAAGEDINQTVDALLRAALTAPADKPSKKK